MSKEREVPSKTISEEKTRKRKLPSSPRKLVESFQTQPIQRIIAVSFTIITISCMLVLCVVLFHWFSERMEEKTQQNASQVLDQTATNIEVYLKNMRSISDAMYYSVIKDKDLAEEALDPEMSLIYEVHKGNLISVACYTRGGNLVAAAPVGVKKEDVDVTRESWFEKAVNQIENIHFSAPHVSHIFEDNSYRYDWVVSLSRAVELTNNGTTSLGVLSVDMNYGSIQQLFTSANEKESQGYIYLMDGDGELIYHPKQQLIYSNLYEENNLNVVDKADGSFKEEFQGETRLITVKTVSYTGWKIVYVYPMRNFRLDISEARYFVVALACLLILMIVILNQIISSRIAEPLMQLNESVKEWESGNMDADIYIGGSTEVAHLGQSLQSAVKQLKALMEQIVEDQEEKRKSELDALQSQINPHFLYNTLDSIVWMIEGEKYDAAVFMITQLASLFRISLSKGRTIIPIGDEITHVKNYMNIQQIRYKNKFTIQYEIDEEILTYCTVKLVVQPILENAIYYGVQSMDGDGQIVVRGYKTEENIYLEVEDNGLGMPLEVVEGLLTEKGQARAKGSGVGLVNVHNRIRLRFGEAYGLHIISAPDEGTTVQIRLPAIPYSAENVELLENGKQIQEKEETHEK
ncbi:MAG: sensor histidine kinase [Lachnospiraceae bacterium]